MHKSGEMRGSYTITFRPDITEMVDWALKNNYLPTQSLFENKMQKYEQA